MNKYAKFSKVKTDAQQCGHSRPKVKYGSEEKARIAVSQLEKIGIRGYYKCPICRSWHVTSSRTNPQLAVSKNG